MLQLSLIDDLGDSCTLTFVGLWKNRNKHGLIVAWVYKDADWLPKYQKIPIPLFDEWWPKCNFET